MKLDLNFLLQPPDFSTRSLLTIEALAPLSMVASLPGKYYRSQPEPTPEMLYGMLENALGWHISKRERDKLSATLKSKFQRELEKSGVGFVSLLQFHLRFAATFIPPLLHYDDYWSQHQKGSRFTTGSRNYDYRLMPLLNAAKDEANDIKIEERAGHRKDSEVIFDFQKGERVHIEALRGYFPQYYVSPTPREYVWPNGAYKFIVETSEQLSAMIYKAIEYPSAPLYLGSNDGWIEVTWENLKDERTA
jgi:CRISPR-associated protein Cas5